MVDEEMKRAKKREVEYDWTPKNNERVLISNMRLERGRFIYIVNIGILFFGQKTIGCHLTELR